MAAGSLLPGFACLAPGQPGIGDRAKKIVGRYIIVPAQSHQMPDGHLVSAPFVTGIHGLGSAQNVRDLDLRQIIVLP